MTLRAYRRLSDSSSASASSSRDDLASLLRTPRARVLAPDGARARLGQRGPTDPTAARLVRRTAIGAATLLALVVAVPSAARAFVASDLGRSWAGDVLEEAVSRQIHGRLSIGGVDELDGERIALHDVRLEDEAGREVFEVDAVELEYDALSMLAGRLVCTGGRAKGGHVVVDGSGAPARLARESSDILRLDALQVIDLFVIESTTSRAASPELESREAHALVRLRVPADGSAVVVATRL